MSKRLYVAAFALLAMLAGTRCLQAAMPGDAPAVRGEMKLEYVEGFLMAPAGGGWVVIDVAAGTSVVAHALVPGGVEIRRERTSTDAAAPALHYAIAGVGITIDSYLGTAVLPELNVGGLPFPSASVRVAEKLPAVAGRPVVGILGGDLLRRAEVAALEFKSRSTGKPVLMLKPRGTPAKGMIEVPMTVKNDVLFVRGDVNGKQVDFLLDTGSPESFMSPGALRTSGLVARPGSARTVQSVDGSAAKVSTAMPATLRLGSRELGSVAFNIGQLPVFRHFTEAQQPALLGNDVLESLKTVEFDFSAGVMRIPG